MSYNDSNPNLSALRPGTSGYHFEDEDNLAVLMETAVEASTWLKTIPQSYTFPKTLSDLSWHRVENQGQIGSCQGVSGASIAEAVFWLATGGQIVQFSGWAHYRLSQKRDNISGDRGSTLAGGAWVGQNIGFIPEPVCPPYPSSYSSGWQVTDEMLAAAEPYRIKNVIRLRSYDDAFKYLSSGQGFVHVGSRWTQGMDCPGNLITNFYGGASGGRHSGGHAYWIGSWSPDGDNKGRHHLIVLNTWSKRWGDEGAKSMTADAVDQCFNDPDTVVLGYSDLAKPVGPRKIDVSSVDWT